MSEPPFLLVITPTLGRSVHLDQTVASVAALRLPVVHLLSVPAVRVGCLQDRYPDVRVVPDAGPAGGIYGALNAALAQAPADWAWFTYLNDDDFFLPGFRSVACRHLARSHPEPVTYGNVELVDGSGRRLGTTTVERNPGQIPALLQQGISPLMQQGMLFRRDCVERLKGFDLRYRLCADLDFWLRALTAGEAFRHYDVPVARFRVHAGQLSGDTALTMREQDDIVARLCPAPLPAWRRRVAALNYRLRNLPRYCGRLRTTGWRTSYQMLHPSA